MIDLKGLRKEIDLVDEELISCLNKRFQLSKAVGELKLATGQAVLAGEREAEIRERLREKSLPEFEASIRKLYEVILEESRNIQKRMGRNGE